MAEPSLEAATELRAAFEEQQRAIAVLLEPDPEISRLQAAAGNVAIADARLEAAIGAVKFEIGALELPILRDERPRLASEIREQQPTDG